MDPAHSEVCTTYGREDTDLDKPSKIERRSIFRRPSAFVIRILLPIIAVGYFLAHDGGGMSLSLPSGLPWSSLIFALLCYFAAQIFRAARLAAIAAPITKLTIRSLILLHFHTTLLVLVIPFKLGELYRVRELAVLGGDWVRAALVVLVERATDAFVLIMSCALFIFLDIKLPDYAIFIAMFLATILIFSVFTLTIFEPALKDAQRYLFIHHVSSPSRILLTVISSVRSAIHITRESLHGRTALIVGGSIIIWALEFVTAFTLIQATDLSLDEFLAANVAAPLLPQTDSLSAQLGLVQIWLFVLLFAYLLSLPLYFWIAETPRGSSRAKHENYMRMTTIKRRDSTISKPWK